MIVFDKKEWIKKPDIYPMVRNFTISPLIPYRPMFNHQFGLMKADIEDGSILIKRDNGHFFAVPLDVYEQIVCEVK